MIVNITLFVALILTIIIPTVAFYASKRTRNNYKKSLLANTIGFFGLLVLSTFVLFTEPAHAAEGVVDATAASISVGLGYLAAAFSMGCSCIGSGIAVASAASSALGAISEDEKIFGKALIFAGLAEGVALFGFLIAFLILGKLPTLG